MSATVAAAPARTEGRSRTHEIWRIARLHVVNPSILFGVPWLILGAAWAVSVLIAIIITAAGANEDGISGMRYSWAVLSPQWYMVAVGVQAIAFTFSFALGFGATRRDYWLGTSVIFVIVSLFNAVAIATLVQIEKATGGWWLGAHVFDALWYGIDGWPADAFTTFVLQLTVLFLGASVTTVYMRWRVRGMMAILFAALAILIIGIAAATFSESWVAIFTWLGDLGVVGFFSWLLVVTLAFAVGGYVVIRRATPR
ncbi:MAG: hypothetical protein ABWX82_01310 [Leifsonia sp.]